MVRVELDSGWAWLGLAQVGTGWHGLARVGSGFVGLVYCILLDSIFVTALLDFFPNSPARSAGLVGILLSYFSKPKKSQKILLTGVVGKKISN